MQLSELVTEVRLRANVPSTDGIWTDAYVKSAINEALLLIGQEYPWPWLEVSESATGADPIDMSAFSVDVRDIKSVVVDSFYEAAYVTKADTDRYESLDRGRYVFAVQGDDLIVRPEVGAGNTVVVNYYRDEPRLSNDADTPLLPAAYHPAIVHRACAIGFEGLDDASSAGIHEARASRIVAMMTRTALRKVRTPTGVRVRPGAQF